MDLTVVWDVDPLNNGSGHVFAVMKNRERIFLARTLSSYSFYTEETEPALYPFFGKDTHTSSVTFASSSPVSFSNPTLLYCDSKRSRFFAIFACVFNIS